MIKRLQSLHRPIEQENAISELLVDYQKHDLQAIKQRQKEEKQKVKQIKKANKEALENRCRLCEQAVGHDQQAVQDHLKTPSHLARVSLFRHRYNAHVVQQSALFRRTRDKRLGRLRFLTSVHNFE